jgi:cellulose synthase/poly-beta-1,6-N-acetylglucosamine synthase-like glycosyltransferase
MLLFFRIIEKLLIVYFVFYLLVDIGLFLYSFVVFLLKGRGAVQAVDYKNSRDEFQDHMVTIIVPAYNEAVTVTHCTTMLLHLDYPAFEVIVVNDGSFDTTLDIMLDSFSASPVTSSSVSSLIHTAKVRRIYQADDAPVTIIDKENGGKADAINAGINFARGQYVCTIDADSILDQQALKYVVAPFIRDSRTIVTGGQLAPSNDMVLRNNRVVSAKTPRNIWVLWQIIEYIKSFMVSRLGLSRVNGLLIMSGAFSLFRHDELVKAGGFLSSNNNHPYIEEIFGTGKQTVCEDMEIVVRLFRYRYEHKEKAKAVFLPGPVCWTEVPEKGRSLFTQRERWHRGLMESLYLHRSMILEPKYKATGLIGMPYYILFEVLAPLVKVFSVAFVIVAAWLNMINLYWLLLLVIGIMLLTAIISGGITAMVEYWSRGQSDTNRESLRYKNFWEWSLLILAAIVGEYTYSFFKCAAQLQGVVNVIRKKTAWGKFDRKGMQNFS